MPSPSFDTALSPAQELQFQQWKQRYAPHDSGVDYDLRGAFLAGLTPGANGHWPDTYKKPNHPTFSVESIYAKDAPEKAGHWNGETYMPAQSARTVPVDDLPDELRGTIVPPDDLPAQPSEGELLPRGGGPQNSRVYVSPREKMYRDTMAAATGQANARGGVLDMAVNGLINAPADIGNAAANFVATAVGRPLNMMGVENNIEQDARSHGFPRVPLLTQEGRDTAAQVSGLLPEWMRNLDPIVGDTATVLSAAVPGRNLLPRMTKAEAAIPGAKLLKSEGLPQGPVTPLKQQAAIRDAGAVAPQAKAAGFDVTPSTVAGSRSVKPSGAPAMLEGPARNPEASLRNAQQLNRRLGDELAVQVDADARATPAAVDEARLPAFGVYETGKGLPGGPSAEYSDAVVRAIQGVDVPTEAAPEVARLVQKYQQVGDSAQLVEDLKALRRNAAKRREGDTANQVASEAISDVEMAIADELENELGRRGAAAGDAGFQDRLRGARQHLAQLHEFERALHGGYVDAAQLAARQQKTGRLTGNLQLGAHMGENLPDVFQHPQNAAPAAMGRTPEAWGARSFLFRTGERLGGGLLSRRSMRKFNENIPVGPNALDEFNISPVRDRRFDSPMGPNDGPQPPPLGPDNYGPLPFRLEDDPLAPRRPSSGGMPQGAGTIDWEPPLAPGDRLPIITEDARFADALGATDMASGLPFPEPNSIAAMLDAPVSRRSRGPKRPLIDNGSFASQLGPVAPRLDELLGQSPGMPPRPRGVAGPRSAQLTDPQLPEGLQLGEGGPLPPMGSEAPGAMQPSEVVRRLLNARRAEPELPKPMFGPEDEFTLAPDTGPAAPRMDITEQLPSQGTSNFPDRYKRPEAKRIETDKGYISYREENGAWQIDDAFVKEGERGKGYGQEQLLDLARKAKAAGKKLYSDWNVTPEQKRVYEKLKAAGKITYKGPYDDGSAVFKDIRPTKPGISDLIGE